METRSLNASLSTEVNEHIEKNDMNDNSEFDECVESAVAVDEIRDPDIGMEFDNIDACVEYYIKYANKQGFPMKKRSSEKGDDGEVNSVVLSCSRTGQTVNNSKNALKLRPNSKTGCKARIRIVICYDGKWRVSHITLDHNHALSPEKSRFYKKNRVMRMYVKRRLEVNDRAGIRPNKNFSSFLVEAGGQENVPFLEKDCYNHIEKMRRLRLGDGDATAVQNYFLKMQANNVNFFYLMDLDKEGRLMNVFWADARSRVAYEEFGDAITFDTTYLTNKYDMPFAPFVGVNHHGQSTLLGCGLISSEDVKSFTWLFKSWLACMNGRAPTAIITDQDKAMKKAIENVFPNTRHRWCLWHIMKKLPEKLRGYNEYESIKYAMQKVVYDSLTCEGFEENWSIFIEKFKLETNDWLTGLYSERSRWVPTFLRNTFWAGMSSTQRSESMNAFFDGYVNSKTSLKQFVEQYENALRSKVQKETKADFDSFNSKIPCITFYPLEEQFQKAYTTSKFKEFQGEIRNKLYCNISSEKEECRTRVFEISQDKMGGTYHKVTFTVCFKEDDGDIRCNCQLFEFRGILCCHALTVLLQKGVHTIPEKFILRRWRKDVKRCHTKVKIIYSDWMLNPENERFDRMCNTFYEAADLAANNEDKTKLVLRWSKWLTNELKKKDGTCENSTPLEVGSEVSTPLPSGDNNNISKESSNICSPLVVRGKGRPRFKRLQGNVEKAIKKVKRKKEDKRRNEKEKMDDINWEKASQIGIGSQDSIVHVSQDLNCPSNLITFNANQLYRPHVAVLSQQVQNVEGFPIGNVGGFPVGVVLGQQVPNVENFPLVNVGGFPVGNVYSTSLTEFEYF